MVISDGGQLYTIEGFAAALIMIITAFLVLNATSVYTAGDTHITDMQLEALGTDALKMMDTKISSAEPLSPLQEIIKENPVKGDKFKTMFMNYTNVSGAGPVHDIQFFANYTCRYSDNTISLPLPLSSSRSLTGGEHTVRATRWVIVDPPPGVNICGRFNDQAVLVEVLLWRD
ncbi:MAG TPA: hypothetical protein VMW77_05765 [Methanoregula sp.]|nr:hypothetical protein [Methanoregula sp.]